MIGEVGTQDFASALFSAARTLVDVLGSSEFNVAIWMPRIGDDDGDKLSPSSSDNGDDGGAAFTGDPSAAAGRSRAPKRAVAHVVARDSPLCGLSLYGATNIVTDPYQVVAALDEFMRGDDDQK